MTEETEETQDRGENRPRTDTDTDPECMQSRQKKEQMKSIFLSDSDEEAIVDFVKQHEELFDKTPEEFQRQAEERKTLGNCCSFQEFTCQYCEEVVRHSTHRIWQAHTDQVRPSCSQEHQETDLVEGQFQLSTRSHQKEGSVQVFWIQSPLRPLAATASVPETSRVTESEMEISMLSDVTHHPASTSPLHQPATVAMSTPQDAVLDQFQQMRSMMSAFFGTRQDPTPGPRQPFCNYLHSEIEHLEERDFLTFRNETVKLLSEIQYKAEECKSTGHISSSRSNTGHSRTRIHIHHTGYSTIHHTSLLR